MPLNIKDEDVHDQARRLARLTGVSITAAVRQAVATQLATIEQQNRLTAAPLTQDRLLDVARICAEALKGSGLTSQHADLYGEDGLPR
jgi:antitoxin VapB